MYKECERKSPLAKIVIPAREPGVSTGVAGLVAEAVREADVRPEPQHEKQQAKGNRDDIT